MASPLFPDPSAWKAKLSVEDAIWAEACASTVSAFSPKNSFSNQPYQHKDANEAGFLRRLLTSTAATDCLTLFLTQLLLNIGTPISYNFGSR
uniref:Uncharacterized protein n=1 Tax=Panagrellus redivivus TaxID=6233 RepID=A0A7E4USX0_PANRE